MNPLINERKSETSDDEQVDGTQGPEVPENGAEQHESNPAPAATSELGCEAEIVATGSPTFAKVEKSLISLGFFTPSSRRTKNQKVKRISFTRSIGGKKVEATAEFHPSAVFGLPITADQDKFLALHDIITNTLRTEGRVTNPVRFTSAALLRLLNNRVRTGKNYKDISEWLDVMTTTTIVSNGVVYEAGKQRFARDRFHVFERAVSVGKELPDGTIADANYVWLSEWQLDNINQNFLLPIDLRTYRELKNHIAKALVPLLQVWLYASQRAGSFEKRYDELCEMLGLQIYKAPSLITRQLKPSLDELVRYEYLEKWRIEKTTDHKSYKLVFFHGQKFHRDRRRRLEQKNQNEPPVIIAESQAAEPELPEPGRLEPEAQGPTPNSKQLSIAPLVDEKLLAQLSACGIFESEAVKLLVGASEERRESIADYIDYWRLIPGDKKTPGLLHSLIKKGRPLPATFETRRQRTERLKAEARRQKLLEVKELLTHRYEEYRRMEVDRFIAEELTPEEFDRRVALQKIRSQQEGLWDTATRPRLADDLARSAVRVEIREEIPLLPFAEFQRQELPKILSELEIPPGELGIDLPQNVDSEVTNATGSVEV